MAHFRRCIADIAGGRFKTMEGTEHFIEKWDLLIAHPPCTYLTNTGNRWFDTKKYGPKALIRWHKRAAAAEFFMNFVNAECDKIAIENPIGYMSTYYRPPDQIVQPYEFGMPARKATCLWLKGLTLLQPTEVVEYELENRNFSKGLGAAFATDKRGKIISWNDPETKRVRSKTVPGIAKAMAEQWGGDIR